MVRINANCNTKSVRSTRIEDEKSIGQFARSDFNNHSKADTKRPSARRSVAAEGGACLHTRVIPRAAAQRPILTASNLDIVRDHAFVQAPFPDVPRHIHHAEMRLHPSI